MSRYVNNVTLNQPEDFVNFIINDFLQKNEFRLVEWKKESCYRAGGGMEGNRLFKWSYANGILHLEAWLSGIKKEMGFDGFFGIVQKKMYKSIIDTLLVALHQPVPNVPYAGAAGQPAPNTPGAGGTEQPILIPVQTVNQKGQAVGALICGTVSIPGGIFFPLPGVVLGCIGLAFAKAGMKSSDRGMASAGKVCSIIGIVAGALSYILNIVGAFAGWWY